jgi:signal transduction histidine kinase
MPPDYSSSSHHSDNINNKHSPEPVSNSSKLCKNRFSQWLNNLKVGQKISFGYIVALGIAVVGTSTGIFIAERLQHNAWEQEDHSQEMIELLNRLQITVLQSRTHQQKLIPLIAQPEKFQQEYTYVLGHMATIKQNWSELKDFIDSDADEVNTKIVPRFLQTNIDVAEEYSQQLHKLVQQINLSKLKSPEEIEKARKLLLDFTNSPIAVKFDGISDELADWVKISYEEYRKAEEVSRNSYVIFLLMIVGSMLFSVAIAAILATYTSRVITLPLEATTKVAQQATLEDNFDLQTSVTTNDELGILASSLNQLIQRVKELLQQQKLKNEYLQQTLQELQSTQAQLIQSEKMSSLGQLVAGVAHEINNPVSFIYGNLSYINEYTQNLLRLLQLYQQHYPNPSEEIQKEIEASELHFLTEDLTKLLTSMQIGTERIREIVLSLRNFSRVDEAEFKKVDIHEGIESTLMILQNRLKAVGKRPAIEIVKDYGQLPLVECYPGQLNQVFMNLLTNAIDALEESFVNRHLSLVHNPEQRTNDKGLMTTPQIRIRTEIQDNFVLIGIVDNGPGISEKAQTKLFDPFFTTKPVGKGTGLGLSISYQIITKKHGGKLYCDSTPGKGAEFVIEIPITHKYCATVYKEIGMPL